MSQNINSDRISCRKLWHFSTCFIENICTFTSVYCVVVYKLSWDISYVGTVEPFNWINLWISARYYFVQKIKQTCTDLHRLPYSSIPNKRPWTIIFFLQSVQLKKFLLKNDINKSFSKKSSWKLIPHWTLISWFGKSTRDSYSTLDVFIQPCPVIRYTRVDMHRLAQNCTELDRIAQTCTDLHRLAQTCPNLHKIFVYFAFFGTIWRKRMHSPKLRYIFIDIVNTFLNALGNFISKFHSS